MDDICVELTGIGVRCTKKVKYEGKYCPLHYNKCQYYGTTKNLCNEDCKLCQNRSFASHPKSICLLDKEKDNPRQIFLSSTKELWFRCNNKQCNHIFKAIVAFITKGQFCPYCCYPPKKLCNNDCEICYNKSFASHPKSLCLLDKEKDNPRQIFLHSNKKMWFKCDNEKCKHKFEAIADNVVNNSFCPYCANKKLCESDCEICYNKSFASHPKSKYLLNKEDDPRHIFLHSGKNCWFKCDNKNCRHEFESRIAHITCDNSYCPYCCFPPRKMCDITKNCKICYNKSFASHPKSKYMVIEENDKKPEQIFKFTAKIRKFICDNEDCKCGFKARIFHISHGGWCPACKSKTQAKLFKFLKENFPHNEIIDEFCVNWCKNKSELPFDFLLKLFNLIIELDGEQHFRQVSNWMPPEEQQYRDCFKMQRALENDHSVIRIYQPDVLFDTFDWPKIILDHIKFYETPTVIYLSKDPNIYNNHKLLMQTSITDLN